VLAKLPKDHPTYPVICDLARVLAKNPTYPREMKKKALKKAIAQILSFNKPGYSPYLKEVFKDYIHLYSLIETKLYVYNALKLCLLL